MNNANTTRTPTSAVLGDSELPPRARVDPAMTTGQAPHWQAGSSRREQHGGETSASSIPSYRLCAAGFDTQATRQRVYGYGHELRDTTHDTGDRALLDIKHLD